MDVNSATFSVRIVTADHYLSAPIRSLDPEFSESRGSSVKRLPVVRIFGTTPAGQKACVHVHGLFPYLYAACAANTELDDSYLEQLATSIDQALQISLGQCSRQQQHVFQITAVAGMPYYGYHKEEQLFLKIRLFNPTMVPRLADLLRNDSVMQTTFIPFEAHVPFLLQVFIDYNLYGMSFLNLAGVRFRLPLPDSTTNESLSCSSSFSESGSAPNRPTKARWTKSRVTRDQILDDLVDRQTKCELELDAVAVDILNQHEQETGTVSNPGIAAIWKEEQKRCAAQGLPRPKRQSSPERPQLSDFQREQRLKSDLQDVIEKNFPDNQSGLLTAQATPRGGQGEDARSQHVKEPNASSLNSSQSLLLNSGSFSVQLLADLASSGVVPGGSQWNMASLTSSQSQPPSAPAAAAAAAAPAAAGGGGKGGAATQLSLPPVLSQSSAGHTTSCQISPTSEGPGLSSLDLLQLLENAEKSSQRGGVVAHCASQSTSTKPPPDTDVHASVSPSQLIDKPDGVTLPPVTEQFPFDLDRLAELQSARDEFLADSDDDQPLRELASLDEEESRHMSQVYWGNFAECLGGLNQPQNAGVQPKDEHSLQPSPQSLTPGPGLPSPRNLSFSFPRDASTPMKRPSTSAGGALSSAAQHKADLPGAPGRLCPGRFNALDSGSLLSVCGQNCGQSDSSMARDADSTLQTCDASSMLRDHPACSESSDDDTLSGLLSSSTVARNLRQVAKRLRKSKRWHPSALFDNASVFYLTDSGVCPVEKPSLSAMVPNSRAQCDILHALDFPTGQPPSRPSTGFVDILSQFDAFAVPSDLPFVGSARCHSASVAPSDAEHTSAVACRVSRSSVDSRTPPAVLAALSFDASPFDGGRSATLVVSDESSAEDGSEVDMDDSCTSPGQLESTLKYQDVALWDCVQLGDSLYRMPDFPAPTWEEVEHTAAAYGLPSCIRVDARFSDPSDYRGPKTVGATRICVPALTAIGDEKFDSHLLASDAKSWSGLIAWRSKVNKRNYHYRCAAGTIDFSSVSVLHADSVRLCAEERAKGVSQRPCWLIPVTPPPSHASVVAWCKKRRPVSAPTSSASSFRKCKEGAIDTMSNLERAAQTGTTVVKPQVNAPGEEPMAVEPVAPLQNRSDADVGSTVQFSPLASTSTGGSGRGGSGSGVGSDGGGGGGGGGEDNGCLVATQLLPVGSAESMAASDPIQQDDSAVFDTRSSDSDFPAAQPKRCPASSTGSCNSVFATVSSRVVGSSESTTSSSTSASTVPTATSAVLMSGTADSNTDSESVVDVSDARPVEGCSLDHSSPGTFHSGLVLKSSTDPIESAHSSLPDEGMQRQSPLSSGGLDDSLLVAALDDAEASKLDSGPTNEKMVTAVLEGETSTGSAEVVCHTADSVVESETGTGSASLSPQESSQSGLCTPTSRMSGSTSASCLSSQPTDSCSSDVRGSSASSTPTLLKSALKTAAKIHASRSASSVSFSAACGSEEQMQTTASHETQPEFSVGKRCQLQLFERHGGDTPLPKRRFSPRLKSQLDGPSIANGHGFQQSMLDLGEAHSVHECQFLTLLSVEVHTQARGALLPDPDVDAVCALFYTLDWEVGSGRRETLTGLVLVDPSSLPFSRYAVTVDRHEIVENEAQLFDALLAIVEKYDPEVLLGYEVQKRSWGYLLQRANKLDIALLNHLSRLVEKEGEMFAQYQQQQQQRQKVSLADLVLGKTGSKKGGDGSSNNPANAYMARKMSELRIPGRIILNVWRLMRHEVALTSYTLSSVAFHILHVRLPHYSYAQLASWYGDGDGAAVASSRSRVLQYYVHRCHYTLELLRRLDLVARTSEMARLFGLQFYEVLTRGSQFRVESMMLRLTKQQNMLAFSPSVQQRAAMNAPECIPLILEPESRFYTDPVIVVDFQSLYPSMMIAYNYCFSTCLGRVAQLAEGTEYIKFGCSTLRVEPSLLKELEDDVTISPNGVVFVKKHVRHGILPRMLDEILFTRIMVKQAMKQCKSDKSVHRMLDHRQLGLKLIANVTYGYTSANFSGRMPCIDVADSVVRKGRETLERAIQMVRETARWGARVVYGDTDSMFIQVPGVTKERAFAIGKEIVDAVTQANPKPVKLKFEKVYYPCVLQSKKRYCGFKYEALDQKEPEFEAKGIETIRRDGCPAVVKVLGRCLKMLFKSRDVSHCKAFVQRQCIKLLQGKVNLQDLIIAKEYRGMATYQPTASVPCLEITRRMLRIDPRAEPLVAERVPYVVVCGTPGQPLIHLVRRPIDVLADSSARINAEYYIQKQLLPPLNRTFHLLGVNVFSWFSEMPHVVRVSTMFQSATASAQGNLADFFSSLHCPICQTMTQRGMCSSCRDDRQRTVAILSQRMGRLEASLSDLEDVCRSCCRRQQVSSACLSLDCPVFFRRNQTKVALKLAMPLRDQFLLTPYAMQGANLELPAASHAMPDEWLSSDASSLDLDSQEASSGLDSSDMVGSLPCDDLDFADV